MIILWTMQFLLKCSGANYTLNYSVDVNRLISGRLNSSTTIKVVLSGLRVGEAVLRGLVQLGNGVLLNPVEFYGE